MELDSGATSVSAGLGSEAGDFSSSAASRWSETARSLAGGTRPSAPEAALPGVSDAECSLEVRARSHADVVVAQSSQALTLRAPIGITVMAEAPQATPQTTTSQLPVKPLSRWRLAAKRQFDVQNRRGRPTRALGGGSGWPQCAQAGAPVDSDEFRASTSAHVILKWAL